MRNRTGDFGKDVEEVELDTPETSHDPRMQIFYDDVAKIRQQLAKIRDNIKAIKACYDDQVWSSVEAGGSGDRLERLITETNAINQDIRTRITKLTKENKSNKGGDANSRTRHNLTSTLSNKFLDLVKEYQEIQENYKDQYRNRIHRQAKIVSPYISDVEVDEMIDSGDSQQIFADRVSDERKHADAKNALLYIQEQHRDVIQLEKSITELHQLFVDMQNLVNAQGEMLSQIEHNIQQAANWTAEGVETLAIADHQTQTNRKKRCLIICILLCLALLIIAIVIITIIVVVVVVYFEVKHKTGSGSSNSTSNSSLFP